MAFIKNSKNITTEFTSLEIYKSFENNKLNEIDIDNFVNLETKLVKGIIINLLPKIKYGPINNPGKTTIKNFKMSHFRILLEFIIKIVLNFNENNRDELFKGLIDDKVFLCRITLVDKGHNFLFQLKPLIEKFLDLIPINDLLILAAQNGTIPTFMFWKNYDKTDIFSEDNNQKILIGAISNSDDRIFNWYLQELEKNNHKQYFQKSSTVEKILQSIFSVNSIPTKYKLQRIKSLSKHCNLIPYFSSMIEYCYNEDVLAELFKHYYVIPLDSKKIITIINKFCLVNNYHDNLNKIYNLLKTNEEKQYFKIFIILNNNCFDIYGPFNENDYDINLSIKNISEHIVSNFNRILTDSFYNNQSISSFLNNNCKCGGKCMSLFFNFLLKNNFFNISINNFNQKLNLCPLLQLYTRFYTPTISPSVKIYSEDYKSFIIQIKINKLLSFLRVIAKKKAKTKVINFQMKFTPVINELLNFSPNNKPVMKLGSKNWQYKKTKFTHIPPRHLLPYEIKQYNNFLLREKADGILTNNLPLNIEPNFEDITIRQVKAEFIEDLELYLVFDIDLPNTNIIERYEHLRNNHPYTKNTTLKNVSNMEELISEIKKERELFNRFLEESANQTNKIRWYPKASYMVNNCSNDFKFELISNIIENSNPIFNKIINEEGKYNCDGLILSPLNMNHLFRDIKIKPKELMTIDLLYDGKFWLDKEKNKYTNISNKNNRIKENKIYRCYPLFSNKKENEEQILFEQILFEQILLEPREIRFDKKYPNNYDIINMIQMIQKYNWMKEIKVDTPYYHLEKPMLNFKHNNTLISLLKDQTGILEKEITKLNPENGKTWLDLGCGKGKLVSMIRKYNPKKYVGLDIDVNILLNNLHIIDEEEWVKFSPCNLRENWNENSLWYNITGMKFDYIVLNFSLMHLFDSDLFWKQIGNLCNENKNTKNTNTKILFNLVSEKILQNDFRVQDAYMKYKDNKVIYYFPWCHTEEMIENFIKREDIEKKLKEYNFKIEEVTNPSNNKLSEMYDWYQIRI